MESQLTLIANDIYTTLGPGYNEVIYHRAMEVALRLCGIQYESEVITPIFYKSHCVGHGRVDIKLNNFIIELKAVNALNNDAIVQTKNYMNHYCINSGIIINFGQSVKNNILGNLGIVLIKDNLIYDFVDNTFKPRGGEINLTI
jgi:GxxExxY protein